MWPAGRGLAGAVPAARMLAGRMASTPGARGFARSHGAVAGLHSWQRIATSIPAATGQRGSCAAKKKGPTSGARRPFQLLYGAPGRIRTSDPQVRSLVLYPAELRARSRKIMTGNAQFVNVSNGTSGLPAWTTRPENEAALGRPVELAESEGFEPSMEFNPHTPLAGEPLQPLGQLSASCKTVRPGSITAHSTRGKPFQSSATFAPSAGSSPRWMRW